MAESACDKKITCGKCKSIFILTTADQDYYISKPENRGKKAEECFPDWCYVCRGPDHFIHFRLNDPSIHASLTKVQDAVVASQPELKHSIVNSNKVHVTVGMLRIGDSNSFKAKKVKNILRDLRGKVASIFADGLPKATLQGMGSFTDRSVFTKLDESKDSKQLLEASLIIRKALEAEGLLYDSKKVWVPHVSIIRVREDTAATLAGTVLSIKEASWSHAKEESFGSAVVGSFELSSLRGEKADTGYYKSIYTIDLSDLVPAGSAAPSAVKGAATDEWRSEKPADSSRHVAPTFQNSATKAVGGGWREKKARKEAEEEAARKKKAEVRLAEAREKEDDGIRRTSGAFAALRLDDSEDEEDDE